MRIRHLALSVSDPQRSERFYMDKIGLAGTATVEEWGVRLRLDDGFMLALIEGAPIPQTLSIVSILVVSLLTPTRSPSVVLGLVPLVSQRLIGLRKRGTRR
jgi:hypothetical protein